MLAIEPNSVLNIPVNLENRILRQLSDFLEDEPNTTPYFNSDRAPKKSHDKEEKSTSDFCSHDSQKSEEMINRRVHCYQHQDPEEGLTTSLRLSPRQRALFDEYCRLVGWKDYFYHMWCKLAHEYETTVAEYERLTS